LKNSDADGKPRSRRRFVSAGLSALAAGLLLKVVGSDSVTVHRVYGADGSNLVIGVGNTGSSTTTLSSPVTGGPNAFFDNNGGTGDAQAIQGRITGTSGRAFVGFASATSGSTIALDGVNNSPSGIALRGANTATTGDAVGVQGSTASTTGAAFKALGPGGEVMRVRGDGNIGIGTTNPNSTLHVNGGVSVGLVIKAANYIMGAADCVVLASAALGALTITLPPASNMGKIVHIKKVDSSANHVTVAPAGGDNIQGAGNVIELNQYTSLSLVADGSSTWYWIAST
jgi:hypothetical protein